MHPPETIDGHLVVEYGSFSVPRLPLGYVPNPLTGASLEPSVHAAICSGPGGEGYYTFFCAQDWRTVTFEYNDTLIAAELTTEREFGEAVRWVKVGGTRPNA